MLDPGIAVARLEIGQNVRRRTNRVICSAEQHEPLGGVPAVEQLGDPAQRRLDE
jgi:hypothetical protein